MSGVEKLQFAQVQILQNSAWEIQSVSTALWENSKPFWRYKNLSMEKEPISTLIPWNLFELLPSGHLNLAKDNFNREPTIFSPENVITNHINSLMPGGEGYAY